MIRAIMKIDFLAGTSFDEAVEEAKSLCYKLDVAYTNFKFNGVEVSVQRNSDAKKMFELYIKALDGKNKFVVG